MVRTHLGKGKKKRGQPATDAMGNQEQSEEGNVLLLVRRISVPLLGDERVHIGFAPHRLL